MKKILFAVLFLALLMFLVGWDKGANFADPYSNIVGIRLSLYTYQDDVVEDDESFNLPASTDGIGFIKSGTQDTLSTAAMFAVDADGNVLLGTTGDVLSVWNEDGHTCVFDGGDGYATIRNRLGVGQKIEVIYYYKQE